MEQRERIRREEQSKSQSHDISTTEREHSITTDDVDRLRQCVQLVALLPDAHDKAQPLKCPACGTYLGCMANSQAIAVGHFDGLENQRGQLIGGATISEKKVPLKCPECGCVKRWYRKCGFPRWPETRKWAC